MNPYNNHEIGIGSIPKSCENHIRWALAEGRHHAEVDQMYPDMVNVTGVSPRDATFEDFQREFKCKNIHNTECNDLGLEYPLKCSFPPCNRCTIVKTGNVSKEKY